MAFLQGIRDLLANRKLKKLRKETRIRRICNYHDAKQIGIIYVSDSESTFILVKHFIDYLLKEHGIPNVISLGFVDEKEAPAYHSHILHHDFFTRKELNFIGDPSGLAVESFVEKDFDILIDLSQGEGIPLQFVLERSVARFKVGRHQGSESYDLMVELKEHGALDTYIHQVNHFLRSINHHEERKRV